MAQETRNIRKERVGEVVSANSAKTIVVRVERTHAHPVYGKTITLSKKYHVHDEKSEAAVGDTVRIVETRPLSKLKHWRLVEVITHEQQV